MDHNLTGMVRLKEGTLHAAPLTHLPALLATMELDAARLLRAVGLAPDALARPENILPISSVARLLVDCAKHTNKPHFGLLAGQKSQPIQFGLIGLRLMHAPSVGAAWRGLVLTLQLNDRVNVPALSIRDEVAALSFTPYGAEDEGADHLMDYTLAAACTAMRAICGPKWVPTEAHLAHRAPADARPYRNFFKTAVRFNANRTALLFPRSLLERPVLGADPSMKRKIEEAIADMLRQQDLDLTAKVRRALFAQITQDDVSIDSVARLLGLHKRTLNRRLAESDTSFAQVLGEVRFQLSCQLLAETDLPLTEVAATLNYTDSSAFSRAFRSWAGKSPSEWRRSRTPAGHRPSP